MRFKGDRAFERRSKDLLDFARSYLSEAFPNPVRQGCPPDAALRSLAFNPIEGELALTEHLACCSPCFIRYGELLAELKSQREKEKRFPWSRVSLWTKAHPVVAGTATLCSLLIVVGVGFLLRGIRLPNPPAMDVHRKPTSTELSQPTVAYLPFSLNLSAVSPMRGQESTQTGSQRYVLIPNSPLHLTLTLPLASPEGRYDLKLATKGQTFWSKPAQAHLQKGKTIIQVEADFTQIQAGNYSLEVRSPTGIRFIQLVVISQSVRRGSVGPSAASPQEMSQ